MATTFGVDVDRCRLQFSFALIFWSMLQVHSISGNTRHRFRASRSTFYPSTDHSKKKFPSMVLPQKHLFWTDQIRYPDQRRYLTSIPMVHGLISPVLLQLSHQVISQPADGGEAAADPCAASGAEAIVNPLCPYFHRSWRGRNLTVGQMPVHSHEFLADLSGKTKVERDASENFIRGAPSNTVGSSWVKPCQNYPYCTNPPAPPPLVPPPWQIAAPAPAHIYPSLSEPEYPLPWKLAQKLSWLNRQPKEVRDKLYKQKAEMDMLQKKTFATNYQKGILPENPERIDLRQYSLGPYDMQKWYKSFSKKEKFKA